MFDAIICLKKHHIYNKLLFVLYVMCVWPNRMEEMVDECLLSAVPKQKVFRKNEKYFIDQLGATIKTYPITIKYEQIFQR